MDYEGGKNRQLWVVAHLPQAATKCLSISQKHFAYEYYCQLLLKSILQPEYLGTPTPIPTQSHDKIRLFTPADTNAWK